MKKYLTKRNVVIVVLCVLVLVGCVGHYYRRRAEMEQNYLEAIDAATYAANEMMGGRITPVSDEHFLELRDGFIVAKTQLFDLRGDEATLYKRYNSYDNKYPKAFQMIEWYAGFNVSNIPLTFDDFADDSTDEQAQKLRAVTTILMECRATKIVNGVSIPQSVEEYLQLIEDDPRTAELGFEETWEPD